MRTATQSCALLCTSLLFLSACGTTETVASYSRLAHASETKSAKVYFLRPDVGYFGLEGNAVSISLDDEKLLTLAKGEYTLVYLQPTSGTMTVESTAIRTEFGKTVVKTVKASEKVIFEDRKTYYIAVCKRYGQENSLGFPFLIEGLYANEGSSALKPVGAAVHEPLSQSESIPQTEALSILKDVCVTAQDRERYDRPIQSDCVKVKQMLLQQQHGDSAINQSDTTLNATSFCANVVKQCRDEKLPSDKCRSLIQSYDAKRYGSGTSLLMQIAATKAPQYGYDSGDTALMQYLLGIGFNPNVRVAGVSSDSLMEIIAPGYAARSVGGEWRDVTPLMIATAIGDRRMVEVLLRSGADPNVQNDQDRTALMYAANLAGRLGSDRSSIAASLLVAGAKPDVASTVDSGATALMFAAHNGYSEVVRILLAHGSSTEIMDQKGRTALEIAESRGHTDVVKILHERGRP